LPKNLGADEIKVVVKDLQDMELIKSRSVEGDLANIYESTAPAISQKKLMTIASQLKDNDISNGKYIIDKPNWVLSQLIGERLTTKQFAAIFSVADPYQVEILGPALVASLIRKTFLFCPSRMLTKSIS